MDIFISLLFLALGVINPFFSAIVYYLSQESITNLIEKNYKAAQRLRELKLEYDELINSFIILELISYLISYTFLFKIITINNYFGYFDFNLFLIIGIFFIIIVLFFRFLFQSIGIKFTDFLAGFLSYPIYLISLILKPITILLKFLNKAIVGNPNVEESRDEITELVETAHEEGALDTDEYRILKNIMHFSEILVSDVMTPRTVVFSCSCEKTVNELINVPEIKMYSRFPVWEGESIDDGIIGYVMSKDVLLAALNGKGMLKMRDFVRDIHFIYENIELDTALERFLNRRQHVFMVIDEYGGIEGLITMEDVLETILGVEIVDEVDKVVDLRHLAKQRRDSRIASL